MARRSKIEVTAEGAVDEIDAPAATEERAYVCNRFPALGIGDLVKFDRGLFVTSDPDVQALIESHDWYRVHIHPR